MITSSLNSTNYLKSLSLSLSLVELWRAIHRRSQCLGYSRGRYGNRSTNWKPPECKSNNFPLRHHDVVVNSVRLIPSSRGLFSGCHTYWSTWTASSTDSTHKQSHSVSSKNKPKATFHIGPNSSKIRNFVHLCNSKCRSPCVHGLCGGWEPEWAGDVVPESLEPLRNTLPHGSHHGGDRGRGCSNWCPPCFHTCILMWVGPGNENEWGYSNLCPPCSI